ncbi:hypothetical protein ISF_08879 [Cordyceps fumosorosea ARSEF 2679]|uniref:Methyltransferase domain-containing protein n=1 Tax=Cordyceps fumosorosea (strain ARSEF 2679) TaxID=1081104 RepID=A0A162I7A7_CORFA|nr:hypothetical protein ISF_08879 [Cordyceps fumosorosea ARSEF 2679]OAA53265.1 hypothetical protein ISF_08879 [Cordyceps fumosorosea ARSEF 2679]
MDALQMRPPQDPQIIEDAKKQDWYVDFDDVNPEAREILETYSGVAQGDVVQHVKDIVSSPSPRKPSLPVQATNHPFQSENFVYPCIGMVKFLDIEISKTPCYPEILRRLSSGEHYLEVGCCFGQELRRLLLDGAPATNLHATDLDLSFAALGHLLFRDAHRLPPSTFVAADILDPAADELERQLQGKSSIVSASLFFHLFDHAQGVAIGKRLVGLLDKSRKGLVVGGQVGGEEYERKSWLGMDLYVHGAESFRAMWREIGEATGTTWEVEMREERLVPTSVLESGKRYYMMRFVARQL